jgi:hypothetical protein
LPAAGFLPRITQDLVDALVATATGLDRPAE